MNIGRKKWNRRTKGKPERKDTNTQGKEEGRKGPYMKIFLGKKKSLQKTIFQRCSSTLFLKKKKHNELFYNFFY